MKFDEVDLYAGSPPASTRPINETELRLDARGTDERGGTEALTLSVSCPA